MGKAGRDVGAGDTSRGVGEERAGCDTERDGGAGRGRGASPPVYAELSCQSAFSLLRGASEPETLVERARELGYGALALTDRDSLSGCPRAHQAARRTGLPLVHGVTLSLARADGRAYDGRPERADERVVLLARDGQGWRSLCRLVSAARAADRTRPITPLSRLAEERAGLHALAGPHLPDATLNTLREIFGPTRLDLMLHDRLLHRDRRGQAVQRERAARHGLPLVATGGVRFARRGDKPVHDVLTCVRHKLTLDQAGPRLLPNAEFCLRPVERIAHLFRHLPRALSRSLELSRACRFSLEQLAYRFPSFEVPAGESPCSLLHQFAHQGARARYRPMTAAASSQLSRELALIERLQLAGYFLVVHDVVRFCEREGILCQGRGSAANSVVCYALGITSVDPLAMGLLFERFLSEERGELPDIDLDIAHQDRERVLQYVYRRYGRGHAAMAAEVICWRARSAVRDAGKALGFGAGQVDALAKGMERRFDGDRETLPAAWGQQAGLADDPRLPLLLSLAERLCGLPRHLSIHVGGMIVSGPPLTDAMPVEPAAMAGRTVVPWDKDDLASLGIIKIDLLGLGMLTAIDRCLGIVNTWRGARGQPPLTLHQLPADDERVWDMLCAADTVGVFQVESRAQMNCLPRLRPRCFYDLVVEVALIRPGPIQGQMVHPYLRRRAGREAVSYPHPRLQPILERTLGVPLFQEQGMRIAVEAAGFSAGEADELRRAMGHKRSRERMAVLAERLVTGMAQNGIPRHDAERILAQLSAFADYGFPESHAASFARLVWVSAWLRCYYPAAFLCALLRAQPMGFYPPAVLVSDAQRHGVVVRGVDVVVSGWECGLEGLEALRVGGGERREGRAGAKASRLGMCGSAMRSGRSETPPPAPPGVPCDARGRAASGLVMGTSGSATGSGGTETPSPVPPAAPADAGGGSASNPGVGSGGGVTGGGSVMGVRALVVCEARDEDDARHAVRLGLGGVRGMGAGHEARVRAGLESVERLGPFRGSDDFARRCGLGQPVMEALARLGALADFVRRRRQALWEVAQMARHSPGPLADVLPLESPVEFAAMAESDKLAEDYRMAGVSVRRHPLAILRPRLAAAGVLTAHTLTRQRAGARVCVAGMVICRQRPPTAKGLTFVTLEDETGFTNLVVPPELAAACAECLRQPLLLAGGRLERADGVTNLRVTDLRALGQGGGTGGVPSHDYR